MTGDQQRAKSSTSNELLFEEAETNCFICHPLLWSKSDQIMGWDIIFSG